MGFGGPSLTAYFIVSMFAAPALVKMDVGFEQSHFFVMFFAVFAFLTPPVALVALIASKLAEASYMKSAIEATKAAIGGFLIPIMFIYCPILLLQPQEPLGAVLGIIAAVLCLLSLEVAFVGYYLGSCSAVERVLTAVGGASLLVFFILKSEIMFMIGVTLCVLVTFSQWRKKRPLRGRSIE
jgi:TRAP-type uncharacterized transport system fused permease subunit